MQLVSEFVPVSQSKHLHQFVAERSQYSCGPTNVTPDRCSHPKKSRSRNGNLVSTSLAKLQLDRPNGFPRDPRLHRWLADFPQAFAAAHHGSAATSSIASSSAAVVPSGASGAQARSRTHLSKRSSRSPCGSETCTVWRKLAVQQSSSAHVAAFQWRSLPGSLASAAARLVLSCVLFSPLRMVLSWSGSSSCWFTEDRGLTYDFVRVLFRALVEGPSSPPHQSVVRALTPTLAVQPPHVQSRDQAASVGSHKQQHMDVSESAPRCGRSRQKPRTKNRDIFPQTCASFLPGGCIECSHI